MTAASVGVCAGCCWPGAGGSLNPPAVLLSDLFAWDSSYHIAGGRAVCMLCSFAQPFLILRLGRWQRAQLLFTPRMGYAIISL
jgi:hypothetical protein